MDTTTNNQKLLPAPIPFYKTRWFWGTVILIQFFTSLVFLVLVGIPFEMNLKSIFGLTLYASGMGTWFLIPYVISAPLISTTIHIAFLVTLLSLTFRKKIVYVKYPVIYLLVAVTGTMYLYWFVTHLY